MSYAPFFYYRYGENSTINQAPSAAETINITRNQGTHSQRNLSADVFATLAFQWPKHLLVYLF